MWHAACASPPTLHHERVGAGARAPSRCVDRLGEDGSEHLDDDELRRERALAHQLRIRQPACGRHQRRFCGWPHLAARRRRVCTTVGMFRRRARSRHPAFSAQTSSQVLENAPRWAKEADKGGVEADWHVGLSPRVERLPKTG
eukprot:6177751-Pleurochrysis_carterae.AAC.3